MDIFGPGEGENQQVNSEVCSCNAIPGLHKAARCSGSGSKVTHKNLLPVCVGVPSVVRLRSADRY